MFKSYGEYEEWYNEAKKRFPKIRKQTMLEVEFENYRFLVEYYLISEYCTLHFSEMFYGDVSMNDFQSEVMTPAETKGYMIQEHTDNMIKIGFEGKISVPETAANVYKYWKQVKAIKKTKSIE